MSRIGKIPVQIPSGVKVAVDAGVVRIEGQKGKLEFKPKQGVRVVVEGSSVIINLGDDAGANASADWGSARATINNMIQGVNKGWKRALELNGVGFNAKLQGQTLVLSVGFSHEVKVQLPKEMKCSINKNTIELEAADRQMVGSYAAKIRKIQPPEPYLGKGIKFVEETIRRKAGKAGKK